MVARKVHNLEVGFEYHCRNNMKKKDEQRKEIDQYLADTIMERPYGFSVGRSHYALYPVTLGKMYVLQRYIDLLGINEEILRKDLSMEALRLAKEKRNECLNILYIHTCRTKDEVFDNKRQLDTVSRFDKEMGDEDIAALMIMVLSSDKTQTFIRHLGIDKEHEDMKKVMAVKARSDKNSFTFGGVSIYGSFIQPLIEMGVSWNEILWERSYSNLRLLLADKVTSVYVTDDERKKIRISRDRNRVNGDDREAVERAIRSEKWD